MPLPIEQMLYGFSLPAGPPGRVADPEEGGGSFTFGFRIAGFQYHRGGEVLDLLVADDPIELVREPDNPHDPQAIRLDWYGVPLGYLPRRYNIGPAALLDEGAPLWAQVVAVNREASPWEAVKVRLSLAFQDLPMLDGPP